MKLMRQTVPETLNKWKHGMSAELCRRKRLCVSYQIRPSSLEGGGGLSVSLGMLLTLFCISLVVSLQRPRDGQSRSNAYCTATNELNFECRVQLERIKTNTSASRVFTKCEISCRRFCRRQERFAGQRARRQGLYQQREWCCARNVNSLCGSHRLAFILGRCSK